LLLIYYKYIFYIFKSTLKLLLIIIYYCLFAVVYQSHWLVYRGQVMDRYIGKYWHFKQKEFAFLSNFSVAHWNPMCSSGLKCAQKKMLLLIMSSVKLLSS